MAEGPEYALGDADLRLLVLSWYRRARLAQLAHAHAASMARRNNFFLGVPTVVLGTVVGSAIFVSIDSSPSAEWHVAAGLLSLASAILAALHTFLRLDERSREHEDASRSFGALRRELGQLGAVAPRSREEVEARLDKVREAYDQRSEATSNVPDRIWKAMSVNSRSFWPQEFAAWPECPPDPPNLS